MLVGKVILSTFLDFVSLTSLSVSIYYHNPEHMSIPFLKFSQKIFGFGRPAHFTTLKRESKNLFEKISKRGLDNPTGW